MCKSEIFAKIINIVSKETEVSVDQILSSDKKMETVDARYLLVSLTNVYPIYRLIACNIVCCKLSKNVQG